MFYKLLSDLIAFISAVFLSVSFYNIPFSEAIGLINWYLIISGLIFFIFSNYNYGGYRHYVEFSQLSEYSAILKASSLTIVASITALFFLQIKTPNYLTLSSRLIFIVGLLVFPILFRRIVFVFFPIKHKKEKVLIVGAGVMGRTFLNVVEKNPSLRFKVIGFIDDRDLIDSNLLGKPLLGESKQLGAVCEKYHIDRVIVGIRKLNNEKINYLSDEAAKVGIKINFIPNIESFGNNPGKLKEFAGIPLITKNLLSLSPFYIIGKRLIDLVSAIIGIIIASPFWIIIPVLIKMDSDGPVFFKQKRVGLNGKEFLMYKFRSMYVDTPSYAHCPVDNKDPRITKIGRWLRKTSLDELPQLINVFKGDMSLVGPRPEMPFIVNQYNEIEKRRLIVKPGLTGLWQVSPYRNTEINHNLEFDFYYIQNQGFVLDFVIIIMTFFFAIRGITH